MPWNFAILAVGQIILRTGWIFKTESIIMPAVLDVLSGAGWMRGCLPLLNRFGQAIPPLWEAPRLAGRSQKKWTLVASTLVMASCFGAIAWGWRWVPELPAGWAPGLFLVLYAFFFASTGIHQLAFNTLQGKLIEPTMRGRLMLVFNATGSLLAITCALTLLPGWLSANEGAFDRIFAFTAMCFALAALSGLLLAEPVEVAGQDTRVKTRFFHTAWNTLKGDPVLRRLALVGSLFGTCIVLFPHYQALGRSDRLSFDMTDLLPWVVIQNIGTGTCSLIIGPMADRYGNRRVLLFGLLGITLAPFLALWISSWGSLGRPWFATIFVLVGLTPVMYRLFCNYALEISAPADHPRYLSTLGLCISAPALAAPMIGKLVDLWGFDPVFVTVGLILFTAWCAAFGLPEPRHAKPALGRV